MKKTFCDLCKNEIEHDGKQVDASIILPFAFCGDKETKLIKFDVCRDCRKRISDTCWSIMMDSNKHNGG